MDFTSVNQMEPGTGIDMMKLALYKAAVEGKPEDYYKAIGQQSTAAVEDNGIQVMPNGNTVLHVAALHGHQHFVENVLLWRDNNHAAALSFLFAQNKKNESALHCAAEKGHAKIVSILISATKDVESGAGVREMVLMTDNVMDTALHKAVRMGHLEVVKELLVEEDDEYVYPPNNAGETPIYLAANLGFHDCLEQLLNTYKHPTYGGPLGRNALHASLVSSPECTKLLMKREISLCDITDDSGWTPLHYAIKNQHSEAARMILAERSCSAYICTGKGDKWTTTFHIAARYDNVGMMEYMSNNFPDCWMMLNCKSQNVLHEAVLGHSLNAINYILKYPQVDNLIEDKDEDDKTPLALLSHPCYRSMLKSLERVAMQFLIWKYLVFNKQHQTPFAKAFQNRKWSLSKYFLGWKLVRNGGNIGPQSGVLKLTEDKKERKGHASTEKDVALMVETSRTYLLVASLIFTVTFAALLTPPGGFNSNPGETAGTPILLSNQSLKFFVLTDLAAFLCSFVSIFLHVMIIAEATFTKNFKHVIRYFSLSQFLIMLATLFAINAISAAMMATLAPLKIFCRVILGIIICSSFGLVYFSYKISRIRFR